MAMIAAIVAQARALCAAAAMMLAGLYLFFTVVAGVSPVRASATTAIVAVLAIAAAIYHLRFALEYADRGGDPHARRARNRRREQRGF